MLCVVRGALYRFGELVRLSGIRSFRGGGLLHIGKPLPLFAVVELGEVVLRGWKPRLCTFVKLRGAFVGIWKLERLVWARKNLGLWRVWKLGG